MAGLRLSEANVIVFFQCVQQTAKLAVKISADNYGYGCCRRFGKQASTVSARVSSLTVAVAAARIEEAETNGQGQMQLSNRGNHNKPAARCADDTGKRLKLLVFRMSASKALAYIESIRITSKIYSYNHILAQMGRHRSWPPRYADQEFVA